MQKRPNEKIYAMYKGDKFITLGTIKEIAKEVEAKEKTIKFYLSKAYQKRSAKSNKSIVVIELEEDKDE